MNAIWLSLLFRGSLFVGNRVQEVPGCPTGFVDRCPPGSVPAVVLDEHGKPMDIERIKGHAAAVKKKIIKVLRNNNPHEIRWLMTATKIFELCLIAGQPGNPLARIDAIMLAQTLGDPLIDDCVRNFLPELSTHVSY